MKRRLMLPVILVVCIGGCCIGAHYFHQSLQKEEQGKEDFSLAGGIKAVPCSGGMTILGSFAEAPVIENDKDWKDLDVLNPSVVLWRDKYYNYYSGWDGEVWRTGVAVSTDGRNWKDIDANPVLDVRESSWDSAYIAANGSAIVYRDSIYYYYQGQTDEAEVAIGLAISKDGEVFDERTDTPVLQKGASGEWDSAAVADPYVIDIGGSLYMYYLGCDELGIQRLGIAKSEDGISWVKYRNNPIMDVGVEGAFDENGLGEPSVIYQAPYYYMVYTGRNAYEQRNLGLAISVDGVTWKKKSYKGIVNLTPNAWNAQVICDTTFVENSDGTVTMWYGGGNVASPDENLNGRIGVTNITFDRLANIDRFETDHNWDAETISSTDFLKGSYAVETSETGAFAWVSAHSSISFENSDTEELVVRGYMPYDMYQQYDDDVGEIILSFYLNNELICERGFREPEVFEVVLEKSQESGKEDFVQLEIYASDYVNLKQQGKSDDERDLSWIVYEMYQR